jgi:hypothetical protein
MKIKGFSENKVEKVKEAAKKLSVSHQSLHLVPRASLILCSHLHAASSLLPSLPKYARVASEYLLAASNLMRH